MNNAAPCGLPDPITPFAEVEALRAENARLNAAWLRATVRANDPALVTVSREDLRELFFQQLIANWSGNPPENGIANIENLISEMVAKSEADAK